jgi:uncharacterized membrane protein
MTVLDWMTLALALACGLLGGFFFAFSVCVMKSLGALPPSQGIPAMQRINIVVINPWFLTLFLGTAIASLLVAIVSGMRWGDPRAAYWLCAAASYFAGTFLVTMLANVPLNDALAKVEPGSAEGARVWAQYLSTWTTWNHVRTLAGVLATFFFSLALSARS